MTIYNAVFLGCVEPSALENGNVTWSGLSQGSNASYVCDPGYDLDGSPTSVCQIDSSWSHTQHRCESTTICRYILTITSQVHLHVCSNIARKGFASIMMFGDLPQRSSANFRAESTKRCLKAARISMTSTRTRVSTVIVSRATPRCAVLKTARGTQRCRHAWVGQSVGWRG